MSENLDDHKVTFSNDLVPRLKDRILEEDMVYFHYFLYLCSTAYLGPFTNTDQLYLQHE